jgi:hypothetical protein
MSTKYVTFIIKDVTFYICNYTGQEVSSSICEAPCGNEEKIFASETDSLDMRKVNKEPVYKDSRSVMLCRFPYFIDPKCIIRTKIMFNYYRVCFD